MTYLTALLAVVAVAMMATLVLLAVRRDRAIRRNAPGTAAPPRPQGTGLSPQTEGGTTPP